VLARGCWSEVQRFGTKREEPGGLRARGEPHAFDVLRGSLKLGRVEWALLGEHNQLNALAAIGAAEHVGVHPSWPARAGQLPQRAPPPGTARRGGGVKVYDDFAHHPTAMRTTLDGLRRKVGLKQRAHPGRLRAALQHHEAGHDEGPAALVRWKRPT
jgi:UDP-N-acetylmuramate: L-alanyl-gamma-D-glutamyl-meso-diaminopimelate ligase